MLVSATCGNGFKCASRKDLDWSNVAARQFDWSDEKHGHLDLVMNLKK